MNDSSETTQRGRPRWVLPVALGAPVLALALGVGLGSALSGDGDETQEVASTASTTTSTEDVGSATAGGVGSATAGGGGSGNAGGGSGNAGAGGTASRAGTSKGTTTTPKSPATSPPTTAPGPPKPVFYSADADPDSFTCTRGSKRTTYLRWKTTNATTVIIGNAYDAPAISTGYAWTWTCGEVDSVTLVAKGPGGSTSRNVYWRWQEPQK